MVLVLYWQLYPVMLPNGKSVIIVFKQLNSRVVLRSFDRIAGFPWGNNKYFWSTGHNTHKS